MEDINILYYNSFGIAFQWKRGAAKDFQKVQMVFRNTGLQFTMDELIKFSEHIEKAYENSRLCKDCKEDKNCRSLLLNTPVSQVSFAMSYAELEEMRDLIGRTLFQLGLDKMLKKNQIAKR